jgi:hypothetical protein
MSKRVAAALRYAGLDDLRARAWERERSGVRIGPPQKVAEGSSENGEVRQILAKKFGVNRQYIQDGFALHVHLMNAPSRRSSLVHLCSYAAAYHLTKG